MPISTPDDLESGAAAFGQRINLEDEYRAEVQAEVEGFLGDVRLYAQGVAEGREGQFLLATLLTLWAGVVTRLERTLPTGSQLLATVRDSDLPERAYEAASAQLAESSALGLTHSEIGARLRTALGLTRTPVPGLGGEFGRLLLNADGSSTRSWTGESETMARTAATADLGATMIEQLRAQGYTHKRWATRYDSRVRETHANVDHNTVLLDDVFIVGGCALRFPADPMATDLSQVVNCRCVLVGVRYGRHRLAQPYGETPWNDPNPARQNGA